MNLDKCKKGHKVRITGIGNSDIRAQAIRFGISEGEIVCCAEVVPAGPVVVQKNNQEIAIGRRLARQIAVELIS
ncbi:FeoA family protein [Phosphitispora fastidiosa]|uniref:FeoA family protein n=1 Tax=Phosphitispora fastidiosa TaxID=2837202 RepID=UPI001E586ED4|nr:ferrous iron transport protein A [Phosphitispora fastidiosa]MBU7005124.1 Fe2+ transport system protein FeoA [Phosphitispora fastidiosa]